MVVVKGIRRVETVEEFEHQFVTARQEALQAFGNADVCTWSVLSIQPNILKFKF